MLLNGPHQYEDHLKGHRHRKKLNTLRAQGRTGLDRCSQVGAVASSASVPVGRSEGACEGQPDECKVRSAGRHRRRDVNKLREQVCTVFDGCGQVGAAPSGASASAGQPEGAWEGRPKGCEWRDEAWPFLDWGLEPAGAWPLADSGNWFLPTPDPWSCSPHEFGFYGQ